MHCVHHLIFYFWSRRIFEIWSFTPLYVKGKAAKWNQRSSAYIFHVSWLLNQVFSLTARISCSKLKLQSNSTLTNGWGTSSFSHSEKCLPCRTLFSSTWGITRRHNVNANPAQKGVKRGNVPPSATCACVPQCLFKHYWILHYADWWGNDLIMTPTLINVTLSITQNSRSNRFTEDLSL